MVVFWLIEKEQERTEIVYHGAMKKPLNLDIDRSAKTSLSDQIRKAMAKAIEGGVLESGARLPSWQDLAAQLACRVERSGQHMKNLLRPR